MGIFQNNDGDYKGINITVFFILITVSIILVFMLIMPKYSVWSKELSGQAQLKEAEWNRQISVRESEAKKESAKNLADAEIIRARGIAEANKIISGSITSEYLKYKFIEGLNDGHTEVIYVPTEANLPILEARNK